MKKECCLCLEVAKLTREHKIKGSLLAYFNDLQNTTEDKSLRFDDGTAAGGEFKNIKNARVLRPKKNICEKCNSKRSAESDSYFDKFVVEMFHWQEKVLEIKKMVSPPIEDIWKEANHQRGNIVNFTSDGAWKDFYLFTFSKYLLSQKYQIYHHTYDERLIKKYLAKHTICYFDRSGLTPPTSLRGIFMEDKNLDALDFKIYFLPIDFQHGYMNTAIKMPDDELWYALIFSNLAIQVNIKRT